MQCACKSHACKYTHESKAGERRVPRWYTAMHFALITMSTVLVLQIRCTLHACRRTRSCKHCKSTWTTLWHEHAPHVLPCVPKHLELLNLEAGHHAIGASQKSDKVKKNRSVCRTDHQYSEHSRKIGASGSPALENVRTTTHEFPLRRSTTLYCHVVRVLLVHVANRVIIRSLRSLFDYSPHIENSKKCE